MLFIPRRLVATLGATLLTIAMCACGGGGGSSPVPSTNGGGGPTQGNGSANLIINVPPKSQTNTRIPAYISASTQSITVSLVAGSKTTLLATVNLTPGSPNCTTPAGGGLQCTVTVTAPFGNDTFSVSTYSQTNAGGSVLSTGEVAATLTLGQPVPAVTLELDGVPASVSLVLGSATLPVGNSGSTAVIVQALDASGNLIIGPGLFSNPIALAITGDTYHTLSLSTNSVTSPGQVVTLSYNGGTNVGSTITPSGSGITGTPVAFNATGAVLNLFQYYDEPDDIYFYPVAIAALPNGTAAVMLTEGDPEYALGVASPTGMQYAVTGNTTDPYNPGTAGVTFNGGTIVQNMSEYLLYEEGWQYNELAALPNGNVAYAGWFEDYPQTASASGLCYEGDLQSGTLGLFNPTAKTTTEYVLHGYPEYIQADSNGDVWFIEYPGMCGETYYYNGDYAIGELSSSGMLTETDFATAGIASGVGGLTGSPDPSAMSITPNGSTMYIADYDNEAIVKVTLGATPTVSTIALPSIDTIPDDGGMATGPDGTTAWFSDKYATDDDYYYGYIPGSAAFSAANFANPVFPVNYFYSYGMAYGDDSFWIAGEEYGTGIGRLSGLASGTPVAGYYQMPNPDDESQELVAISSGGGYVWAVDDDYGNIDSLQYGAPSTGTVTYTRVRQLTNFGRHRFTPHLPPHRPAHKRAPMSLPRNP